MKKRNPRFRRLVLWAALLAAASVSAQITPDDYQRANRLRERFQGLAVNIPENANAVPNTSRFWYRKSVQGGNEFVLVDAETLAKKPAFDHEKLAAALSTANNGKYNARTLPFSTFRFVENERSIEFTLGGSTWRCDLQDYACKATHTRPLVRASLRHVLLKTQETRIRRSTKTMFMTAWST